MHFGNTTTNKVESSHARLKKYLINSLGNITENWDRIDNMLTNMLIEVQKDFQQSIIFRDIRLKEMVLWYKVQENISREAL
jgi:hypothetical protein